METTLIALGLGSYFLYRAFSMSQSISDFKDKGDTSQTIPTLRQYDEISNTYTDPLNITSNPDHLTVQGDWERGPYGVPRLKYNGAGGSTIPTFGWNYDKI